MTADQLQDDCSPIVLNKDIGRFYSIGGDLLDEEEPAFPCGLVAKSLFNDTFNLTSSKTGEEIEIVTTGIAWESDIEHKFKNLPSESEMNKKQWIKVTDENFIVWMRTAGLPNFRKLYGKILADL